MAKHRKSIIIGFSKPRGFFKQPLSWLIRKIEGTDFSHTYIKLTSNNLGNDLYYHASGSSVVFMGTDLFNKINEPVEEFEHDISSDKYYDTLDFAIDNVGKPYSIMQLVGILMIRICAVFGKKITNPFGKKGYVCTELVGKLLADVYGKKLTKPLNSLTLKDIKELI